MKTQKFSKQELKEFVEKGKTTTCEPVKEGEYPYPGRKAAIGYVTNKNGKKLFSVGEVVQASNEKGEKYWYCPFCFEFNHSGTFIHKNCMGCSKSQNIPHSTKKPLLVRLEKIEKETIEQLHKTHYNDLSKILELRQKALETGAPYETEFWLKSFKKVEG